MALSSSRRGGDHTLDAVPRLGPGKHALAQHIVHVRQHLAEREAHLMRVERAMEKHGQQLRGGFRRSRGLVNGAAALGVVLRQLAEALVEPKERPVMARQHERIFAHARFQVPQRAQIEAKRIAVRIDRPDAHIRRDFFHHLVAGEEQLVLRAVEHRQLGRVPLAGYDLENAPADLQTVAIGNPLEDGRQRRHHFQIGVALREHGRGSLGRQAAPDIEVAIDRRIEGARAERDGEALQIGGLRGQERHAEPLREPAGQADMVGVEMRHDQPRQLAPRERTRRERFPNLPRDLVRDASVQYRPAIGIVDEKDVDVVQPERQRQAKPQDAGRDFGEFAGGGWPRKGKAKFFGRQLLGHSATITRAAKDGTAILRAAYPFGGANRTQDK